MSLFINNKIKIITLIINILFILSFPVFARSKKFDIHITPLDKIRVDNSTGSIKFYCKIEKATLLGTIKQDDTVDKKWRESPTYASFGYYKIEPIQGLEKKYLKDKNFITVFEGDKDASANDDFKEISKYESELVIEPDPKIFKIYSLLLLDVSGTITRKVDGKRAILDDLKNASADFVKKMKLNKNKQIAVYVFDGREDIIQIIDFTHDENKIINSIKGISHEIMKDRATNLYGATIKACELLKNINDSSTSDDICISTLTIFTDGADSASRLGEKGYIHTLNALEQMDSNYDFYAYTIGLGEHVDGKILRRMGLDNYFYAKAPNFLLANFQNVAKEIETLTSCYYKVEYYTPSRKGAGRRTMRLEIEDGAYWGGYRTRFDTDGFTF